MLSQESGWLDIRLPGIIPPGAELLSHTSWEHTCLNGGADRLLGSSLLYTALGLVGYGALPRLGLGAASPGTSMGGHPGLSGHRAPGPEGPVGANSVPVASGVCMLLSLMLLIAVAVVVAVAIAMATADACAVAVAVAVAVAKAVGSG